MNDRKAPCGQMAVSSKQCDNKKQRAINTFKQNERVRQGTADLGKVCRIAGRAQLQASLRANCCFASERRGQARATPGM